MKIKYFLPVLLFFARLFLHDLSGEEIDPITGFVVYDFRAEAGSGNDTSLISPPLVWETEHEQPLYDKQMPPGERLNFSLRFDDSYLPPSRLLQILPRDFFMPEVPPGAVLSQVTVSESERVRGILLKLSLIPLEGDFLLPERILEFENFVFEIPALFIHITESAINYIENLSYADAVPEAGCVNELTAEEALLSFFTENEGRRRMNFRVFILLIIFSIVTILCLLVLFLKKAGN